MSLSGKQALAKPLTRSTKEGDKYFRPPEIESQLEELLGTGQDEQLAKAKVTDRQAPGYVADECLVYLIREASAADDLGRFNTLAGLLLKRITRGIERRLKLLGVAEDDIGDLHQDVVLKMMESIVQGSKGEYYQVRFHHALRREVTKIYDRYRRRHRDTQDDQSLDASGASSSDSDEGDDAATLGERIGSGEEVAVDVERRMLISEALDAITNPDHRKAFVLYHAEGWQVESSNANEPTLSQLFGRTPRMIRNWLRSAERQLTEWRTNKRV